METRHDKRLEERFTVEIPIVLEGGRGFARDISKSGIYFLTDQPLPLGGVVKFSVELAHLRPGKICRLDCRGRVLRVEPSGEKHGVAASISEYCFH